VKENHEQQHKSARPGVKGFYESHGDTLWRSGFNDKVQMHVARSLLQSARLELDSSTSVLEIGSGFGFVIRALRELGVTKYVGVEPTESLRKGLQVAFQDLEFIDSRMPHLSENGLASQQTFDVVIAVHVIEHAANPYEALEWVSDLVRCLTPGSGRLVLVTPDISSYRSLFWSIDYTHSCPFGVDSLPALMTDAGLVDVNCVRTRFGSSALFTRLVLSVARAVTPVSLLDNGTRAFLGRPLGMGLASAALLNNLVGIGRLSKSL